MSTPTTNNNNDDNTADDKESSTANNELSTPPPASLLDEGALRTSESSSLLQGGSALSSPLLNGEHIVLLSLSTEDNTPVVHTPATVDHVNVVNDNISDNDDEVHSLTLVNTEESERLADSAQVELVNTPESHFNEEDDDDNIGNIIITQELFPRSNSSNNNVNVDHNQEAYSPPPESIIHSELLSLSPPPLSLKSDGHHPYNIVHHHDHSMSGTQSLFSGGGATNTTNGNGGNASVVSSGLFDYGGVVPAAQPFPIPISNNTQPPPQPQSQQPQQQHYPPSTSSINNNPNNSTTKQQKHRPPLPPRWAIGTSTDHHHYHPPKQVGTLSHRRVLSTGDASIMSILTDPDCGLENSPNNNSSSVERNSSGVLPIGGGGRKRGVSFDVQLPVLTSGGEGQFSTEEQAAFSALGILQPVLMDDGDDNEEYDDDDGHEIGFDGGLVDLMQPVLDDGDGDVIMGMEHSQQVTATSTAARQRRHNIAPPPTETTQPLKPPTSYPTTPPPPPQSLPPPNSLSRSKSSTNSSSISRRTMFAKSKLGPNAKSITQFEDEANKAIMEALSMYNLEHLDILGDTVPKEQATMKAEEEEEDELGDGIPHQVGHHVPRKTDVSAITFSDGLVVETDPQSHTTTNLGGDAANTHSFEDAAWHEGYDSQGRIDGTLVEERESKYIENELGMDSTKLDDIIVSGDGGLEDVVDSGSVKQVVLEHQASSMSGSDQISVAESLHSRATDISKTSKGSRASKASRTSAEQQPLSAKKGLRHRRGGTRGTGVLSAAQELAAMDTIEESDELDSNRAFKIESDGHGVDNLLEGATLLLQQQEKLEGAPSSDDDTTMPFIAEETSDDMINERDSFQDEEMGAIHANNKKQHKRTPTHLFGKRQKPTKRDRQMERRFRMKMWYKDLIAPRLPIFIAAATRSFLFVIVPLLFVAIILYYGAGNPVAGGRVRVQTELIETTSFRGSWSWWVLFMLRQFIVLSLVKAGEVISIDIIALRTPIFVKVFGSFVTLMFVQARGWPYVLTFWGVFDIVTLYGNNSFARHWLFWQNLVGMCNDDNQAADFLHGGFYLRLLLSMIFIGVVTSLKRLMLAAFLGRRSFIHYGPEFELILAKMVLVSQVAHLARRIEANVVTPSSTLASGFAYTMTKANFAGLLSDSDDFDAGSPTAEALDRSDSNSVSSQYGFGESMRKSVYGKKLISSLSRKNVGLMDGMTRGNSSSKVEMMKLLDEWEEPDLQANAASKVSIKDVLQFRQAVSLVSDTYPFTQSFGPAATRASCVESAEEIFDLLISKSPNTEQKLPFETIVELAEGKDGELMHDKVKALVRLFRPDRKGFLTKLDFVTSVDQVYRELRLFRVNLSNSQQIDESFQGLINILHYFLVTLVVLIIMGFNNWESLFSMTAFFFSFSFMFGPASSKYFEGILLIFVRRPYDIGDKVAISDPESDTSSSGSSTWFVEKVSLYSTTVRFATTNEVATYSNGSLARLRIINAKRSPKAIVYVYNKFGSDVPYKMIQVFKASVESFVKSRPREWAQLNGFRATRVNLELNFIEYVIVLTHRELWQNIAPILQSKADLASFCLEVSKMLNLRYEQPPKPIHLSLEGRHHDERSAYGDDDSALSSGLQQVRDMFKKND